MKTMKTMKTILNASLFLLSSLFLLLSCEQPFRAGLGAVVDIRPPTVTLEMPGAGDFISGVKRNFNGKAEDDYKVDYVELKVTNHPGIEYLNDWTRVNLVLSVQNKGSWDFDIDTTQFPDGDLKIKLRVVDSVTKPAETDDIVFLIRNDLPRIKLTMPYIAEGVGKGVLNPNGPGRADSAKLNYDYVRGDLPPPSVFERTPVEAGSFISGTITYDAGIYIGQEGTDEHGYRYPPQIRVWPISDNPGPGEYRLGEWPSYDAVPWEYFPEEGLFPTGGTYNFMYPVDKAGRFYGFELRVQSANEREDGLVRFHYPRDYWPSIEADGYDWDSPPADSELNDFITRNRYVLFYVREISEAPTAGLWGLEDILKGTWNGSKYSDVTVSTDPDNPYHPYVDANFVNKNGDFTMRVRASHSLGISTAEAYWSLPGTSLRGRFIWDPAVIQPGYNATLAAPAEDGWNFQGFADSNLPGVRSFIFTYTLDGPQANKIEVYQGGTDWETGKKTGSWPSGGWHAAVYNPSTKRHIVNGASVDLQGSMEIEVYVRQTGMNGRVDNAHLFNTIQLDWTPPEVEIPTIDGVPGDFYNRNANPVVVKANGVIQPKLIFTEDGSGMRTNAASYYQTANNTEGFERRYILVNNGEDTPVENYFRTNKVPVGDYILDKNWPGVPTGAGTNSNDAATITGATILRHGAIVDSPDFRIKTTQIYTTDTAGDTLTDGFYWLFVFARDKAYNVGYTKLRIQVNKPSDDPTIEISGLDTSVTSPNVGANSFEDGANFRNRLGSSQPISLRLADDDNLDFGTTPPATNDSGVKITVAGFTNTAGVLAPTAPVQMASADVKGIFGPPGGKSWSGDIPQGILSKTLGYGTVPLPEGIYQISITVGDHGASKMKLKDTDAIATYLATTAPITFWVFVDSVAPTVNTLKTTISPNPPTDYVKEEYIKTANGISSGVDGITITGNVSDKNGPITVRSISIYNGHKTSGQYDQGLVRYSATGPADVDTSVGWGSDVSLGTVTLAKDTDTTQWKGTFSVPVYIGQNVSSDFVFELVLQDRFGNIKSTGEMKYKVDKDPPNVEMLKEIDVFERRDATRLPGSVLGSGGVANDKFTRLANGVISFELKATDDISKVSRVRWWLLPAVTTFSGWTHAISNTGNIRSGELTGGLNDAFNKTIYIDTGTQTAPKLADGEYYLYVMAEDEATNISTLLGKERPAKEGGGTYPSVGGPLQSIYIVQAEDRPFFSENNLKDAVVGLNGMNARFRIDDDDGFLDNNGNVRAGSIKIWLNDSKGFTTPTPPADPTTIGYIEGTIPADKISPVGVGKSVNLNFSLLDVPEAAFKAKLTNGDGPKHYIVRAEDSYFNKLHRNESGNVADPSDTAYFQEYYSFILDSKDPTITITSPATNTKFGTNAGTDFTVTGEMTDAYLKKTDDNNYYVNLRVDGVDKATIKLGTAVGSPPTSYITSITTEANQDVIVMFTIPAAAFTNLIGFNITDPAVTGYLASGLHNLIFVAEDSSNKRGTASLNFTKDTTAPTFDFTTNGFDKEKMLLPQSTDTGNINGKNWWAANANPADYDAKKAWEKYTTTETDEGFDYKLPVVRYDTGVPFIKGTFTDDYSNIKNSSFKIRLDGVATDITTGLPAQIDRTGRSVGWTVYLTTTGTESGTILKDGVHSIQLYIEDDAGNGISAADYGKMYGFRINSEEPTSLITANPPTNVFGDRGVGDTDPVFSVTGSGTSRNLHDVRVRIRYNGNAAQTFEQSVLIDTTAWSIAPTATSWSFTPTGTAPQIDVQETYTWTLNVTREEIRKARYGAGAGTTLRGKYEVIVIAVDRSNKKSPETLNNVWEFIMDDQGPTFTLSTVNFYTFDAGEDKDYLSPEKWLTGTRATSRTVLSQENPALSGRVQDSNNLEKVELELSKWDYATYTWGTPVWYTLLAATANSTGYNLTNWNFGGTAPTDGYYAVRLRAKDVSTIGASPGTGWTSTDNGNPAYSPYAFFFIDRGNPELEHVDAAQTAYSSRSKPNYEIPFSIDATDPNGFDRLEVTVNYSGDREHPFISKTGNDAVKWSFAADTGARTWRATANLKFTPEELTGGIADGSFEINFTVWDLAGKSRSASRTITLDNRAPTAIIDEPALVPEFTHNGITYRFASDIMWGGEAFDIKGTADDRGPGGSASGVADIWYRIGYGTSSATLPANTQTAIRDWALTGTGLDANSDNAAFDTASQTSTTSGSLWFKYAAGSDLPPGFTTPPTYDPYGWVIPAGNTVASDYAIGKNKGAGNDHTVNIRGTVYTEGQNGTSYLARRVPAANLPNDYQEYAIYSLPLVIRVADNAGNVYYELRDIFLFPNGDNPTSKFIEPQGRFTDYNAPRGGQFMVEGTATDNVSVRTVIYRVKAGGTLNPAAESAVPGDDDIVTIPGGTLVDWAATTGEHKEMNDIWAGYGANVITQSKTGWYEATLESPTSYAPTNPWSFTLNAGNELSELIDTKGFKYPTTSANNNMIRVWVEVFVFDRTAPNGSAPYHLMSLGSGGNADIPEPYVCEFYFKSTSPTITNTQISNLDSTAAFTTVTLPTLPQNNVRRNQFAVRATLNSGEGARIGQIAVRLLGDSAPENTWNNVYVKTDATRLKTVTGVSGITNTDNQTTATLTYQFDTATNAAAGFRSVRGGSWADSGGTFTVEIRVRDDSNPPAERTATFTIGVDNFTPLADTVRVISSPKAAGTNQAFLGRVFDYQGTPGSPEPRNTSQAPHGGIQEVRAWFTKTSGGVTRYINMVTGAQEQNPPGLTTRPLVRPSPAYTVNYSSSGNSGTISSITAPATLPARGNQAIPAGEFVKIINQSGGGIWQPSNAWDVFWQFEANTTVMPDGPMTLHYVVIDHVGNASYYTQPTIVVMNKYPKITGVTLYTDNTGEGAVFTTHDGNAAYSEYTIPETPYTAGYLNSGFISKNRVIGFGVNTVSGNAPLKYKARYVERYLVPLTYTNLQAMAGGGSGTRSLAHYANGVTLDANGRPTATATTSTGGFIDLYTIANVESPSGSTRAISAGIWRLLGVASTTVSSGSHFVFQGIYTTNVNDPQYDADFNVRKMADGYEAYVYAYREIIATGVEEPTDANTIPLLPGVESPLTFKNAIVEGVLQDGAFVNGTNTTDRIPEATATTAANATNAASAGTAYFLIKVWDTVDEAGTNEKSMLYDALVVGMRVYLTDGKNPFARLYDLNPYTETAVIGSNSTGPFQTRTLNAAADPTAVGANIMRGGLYNLGTDQNIIKSGYIEPRGGSTALRPYVNYPSTETNPYEGTMRDGENDETLRPTVWLEDKGVDGNDISGTDPDRVSGKILLRGLAWDDQLIDEIQINIGGAGATSILKLTNTANGRKMTAVTAGTAWAYEEIDWQTGHTVEWAYLWDTEKLPAGTGSARANNRGGPITSTTGGAVSVAVIVKDKNGNNGNGLTSAAVTITGENPAATPATFHNTINVNIVPYVTGFRRETPKFATNRSRQGWYSFFQGEPNIRVLGYNLGTNSTTPAIQVTLNGVPGTNLITGYTANNNMPNDGHTFAIPGAAVSDRINVTVGGTVNGASGSVAAWNHSSKHTNKSWNREYSENTSGSELWTNKPYAHIWRTNEDNQTPVTYMGLSTDSTTMVNPAMALDYSVNPGSLHGSWAIRSAFGVFYGVNNNSARTLLQAAQDPLIAPDIDYFPGDTNANNRTVVAVYEWDGLPGVILNTNMTSAAAGARRGDEIRPGLLVTTRATDNVVSSDRWQNPRVRLASANQNRTDGASANTYGQNAIRGDSGRLYSSVYDSRNQSLYYITRNGRGTAADNDGVNNLLYIDGASSTGTFAAGSVAVAAKAGNWSAVDYTGGNGADARPVVAYYDETNDTLRLAYGSTNTSTSAGSWIRRNVLSASDPLFRGSGKYVSMKVDKNDFIHLAFYNSNETTMVYAVGKRDGDFTAYAVDKVVTGGTWTDISVDNSGNATTPGNPWIVYGTGSIGSYDGVRIAYRDTAKYTRTDAQGDPVYDSGDVSSQGWEALTMPANYTIYDDRLNIEAWPPTDRRSPPAEGSNPALAANSPIGAWHAAVGYAGTGGPNNRRMFRIGYFFKPGSTITGPVDGP